MMVWYGIAPIADEDQEGLLEVARATAWMDLRTWIARSITERSGERPEGLDALLKLAGEKPERADSLLLGIERAVRGMKKVKKPEGWNLAMKKLGFNPLALKLSVLFGDEEASGRMDNLVGDGKAKPEIRRQALTILIESDSPNLRKLCEGLIDDPEMKLLAARGLAKFEDSEVGKMLVARLLAFEGGERNEVVGILCGRDQWTEGLLEQIEKKRIPKSVITPYHATQIDALKIPSLAKKLEKVWGVTRSSPDALIKRKEELRSELNGSHLANANLQKGRILYERQCSACHVLYGQGGKLGPDLTGSGRSNLDYLLENVVDPSGAVSADYRMTVLTLKDGRALSGMISGQDRNSLTLRMPGSETVVSKSSIKSRQALPNSIMPAGLFDNLSLEERRDLIGYLLHPRQVSLPKP